MRHTAQKFVKISVTNLLFTIYSVIGCWEICLIIYYGIWHTLIKLIKEYCTNNSIIIIKKHLKNMKIKDKNANSLNFSSQKYENISYAAHTC